MCNVFVTILDFDAFLSELLYGCMPINPCLQCIKSLEYKKQCFKCEV